MKRLTSTILTVAMAVASWAQNPIVQTCYTSDPAPIVSGDRLYVFTGHDEDNADFFWMNEWRLFSTADMVNWQDHGSPLSIADLKWAVSRAWAPQCIERNGKFYFYVPVVSEVSQKGMAIGVAVANKITGPYKDAIGGPLFENGKWDNIDPTVFVDDDEQAYLYWGNPRLYSAKLNKDMISLASEAKCDTTVGRYTEGPWIHKASNGKYIMMYAAGGVPECIAYSVSDQPQGPWEYVGEVMKQDNFTQSFTNHAGIINFKGHDYFFYHTGWLPGGGGFARSVSVEEFKWNADGTLPLIKPTKEGVAPIGTLNPYQRVEAETIAFSKGLKTEWNNKEQRIWVSDIHHGDWLKVREVDFSRGAKDIKIAAASALLGGEIEVRLDKEDGELLAKIIVPRTGGWEEWKTITTPINTSPTGKHDLYFMFRGHKGLKGGKTFNLDWWKITPNK